MHAVCSLNDQIQISASSGSLSRESSRVGDLTSGSPLHLNQIERYASLLGLESVQIFPLSHPCTIKSCSHAKATMQLHMQQSLSGRRDQTALHEAKDDLELQKV